MAARQIPATGAVRPGMHGGAFKPLGDADIEKIHGAVLDILERTGVSGIWPQYHDMFLSAGAWLNDDGRICLPGGLIEDTIRLAAKTVTIHGQDPDHTIEFGGDRVHLCTGGTAVFVLDPEAGTARESTIADVYDVTRMADALDNIHCCNRQLVSRDLATVDEIDINTAYVIASGTRKPFGAGVTRAANAEKVAAMMDIILGGDGAYRKAPICWSGGAFLISPLRAPEDDQDKLEAIIRAGFPIHQVMVPQAGTSAPASLAGALTQAVSESLFLLVWVNLISPGHPFIVGCWPFVSDLRTGAFSGGGGEQAVLMAASAQMMNYYGLPASSAAGMSDSKTPDIQAGYEKAMTVTTAALGGSTLIYAYPGILAGLMGLAFGQMVIDNEMFGQALRVLRGIEVTDEYVAVDVIGEAAVDPGHFMAHPDTLALMETEFLYPRLGDRASLNEWLETPAPPIADRALEAARKILGEHFPGHIPASVDAKIRSAFDIRIPRERMLSGGWKQE